MKRIVAALVAGLAAMAFTLPALAATSGDLIVDGTNYGQPDKVTPGTRHWYTSTPNPKSASVVGGKKWDGKNGKEHLPCNGLVHWVENKNRLVISHCEGGSTTTTTLPPTTTTTVPVPKKPELVVTSECESVTVTAKKATSGIWFSVPEQAAGPFSLAAGESKTFSGGPGGLWFLVVEKPGGGYWDIAEGRFEACNTTTTTTTPPITLPPDADLQVSASCETGLVITNRGSETVTITVYVGDGRIVQELAPGATETHGLTHGYSWAVETGGEVVASGSHRECVPPIGETTTTTSTTTPGEGPTPEGPTPEEPSPTTSLPGENPPTKGEVPPTTDAPEGTTPGPGPDDPTRSTLPFTGPPASTVAVSIGALIALIAGTALVFVARGRE